MKPALQFGLRASTILPGFVFPFSFINISQWIFFFFIGYVSVFIYDKIIKIKKKKKGLKFEFSFLKF